MIAPKDGHLAPDPETADATPSTFNDAAGESNNSRSAHRFVWGFGVVMVILAGGGFLFKLIEFIAVFTNDEPLQFAVMPVLTYLIVAAGYGCLFMWAYTKGQFKNIEGPKYRMLEMQDEIDAT